MECGLVRGVLPLAPSLTVAKPGMSLALDKHQVPLYRYPNTTMETGVYIVDHPKDTTPTCSRI